MTVQAIEWLLAALALAATGYYAAVMAACLKFRRRAGLRPAATRPVSILKPVRGLDPRFEENLRAHLAQDYPRFEILVGVADADDPAAAVARGLGLEVFVCGDGRGGNRKVAILENLAPRACFDLLVVDDADVLPPPDWLARMAAALEQPGVGIASCLYRSRPGRTLGSKIDALHVSAEFPGQALVAAELGGMAFALGAAMAFRREELRRIGGFSAIRSHLADDYQLGARIAALGKRAVLSPSVVETVAGDASLREVWRRHVRWARTVRVSRPGGYWGLFVTFGSIWSLALLAWTGVAAPWIWVAAVCLAARCGAAALAARAVQARLGACWLLLPAADAWALAVWAVSLFGDTVRWRGRTLRLDRQGRIAAEL